MSTIQPGTESPSDYLTMSRYEMEAFTALRSELGMSEAGLLEVLCVALVRIRRLKHEATSTVHRLGRVRTVDGITAPVWYGTPPEVGTQLFAIVPKQPEGDQQ